MCGQRRSTAASIDWRHTPSWQGGTAGPDDQINDLANFENRPDFTEKEKAALRLAERVTNDAHTVDEKLFTKLRRHFDEGEIIELLAAIGLFNYFNRFNDALTMEPTK